MTLTDQKFFFTLLIRYPYSFILEVYGILVVPTVEK